MPSHKYASGEELRVYAENICTKYGLFERAMFQSTVKRLAWDEARQVWSVEVLQKPKGSASDRIEVSADFIYLANGLLDNAKLPDTSGSEEFSGDMFHTARWHYEVTGGSPEDPRMTNLHDKRVGIVGTGEEILLCANRVC